MPEAAARIGVDIGGTFTDLVLETEGRQFTEKLLTTHAAPADAVLDGVRMLIERTGVSPGQVGAIIHGTTLATNALIERKGAITAFLTTEGFRDVVQMGTESRFEQYDLNIRKPDPLVPRRLRLPIPERVTVDGDVLLELDEAAVRATARQLVDDGVESVAVGFMHSYAAPAHERRTAEILRAEAPELWVSLSCEVSPEVREYERFSTTCANAYVQPLVARYLEDLETRLEAAGFAGPLFLMLSNGGLTTPATAKAFPVRLVESGPAGGAILATHLAGEAGLDRVLSFDMGGTTAKICLIDDARPQPSRSFEVARTFRFKPGSGLPLRIPVIEMVEIGAGGGSIARVDGMRRLTVGPDSAGSEPGPACYARGGTMPTVTDANVVLGRISPDGFAGGSITLRAANAAEALQSHVADPLDLSADMAAWGVTEIVDENMSNAAREHAAERGKSLSDRTLIVFGGSAPMHATRIADKLRIDRILVPVAAGVGSAVGFLRAPVSYEVARTAYQRLGAFSPNALNAALTEMSAEAHDVVARGAPGVEREEQRFGYMRYAGQGYEIPVAVPLRQLTAADAAELRAAYDDAYLNKYGRLMDGVDVEVVSWLVTVFATTAGAAPPADLPAGEPVPSSQRRPLFETASQAHQDVPVHERASLPAGITLDGPCLITEAQTTTAVPDGFRMTVDRVGNLILERKREQ